MDFGVNQGMVEELFSRYRDDPKTVAESWRSFFDTMSAQERAALAEELIDTSLRPRGRSWMRRPGTNTRSASPRWCRATACAATASRSSTRSACCKSGPERAVAGALRPGRGRPRHACSPPATSPARRSCRCARSCADCKETYCRTIGVEFRTSRSPRSARGCRSGWSRPATASA